MDNKDQAKSSSSIEKVATILLFLESELPGITSKIIPKMNAKVVNDVLKMISSIGTLPKEQFQSTVEEFHSNFINNDLLFGGRIASEKLIPKDKQTEGTSHHYSEGLFSYINAIDDDELIQFFEFESPQLIALILNYMDPIKMAQLLTKFDKKTVSLVTEHLLNLQVPNLEILWMMHDELQQELLVMSQKHTLSTNEQINKVSAVFESMMQDTRNDLFSELKQNNPQLFNKIESNTFQFEDFQYISDIDFQTILYEIQDIKTIATLMQDYDPTMKEKIESNLSERFRAIIQSELAESTTEPTKDDIDSSKLLFIQTARKLELDNKIAPLQKQTG